MDYIITNRLAAEYLTNAGCMAENPLNVSDHLALSVSMSFSSAPVTQQVQPLKIDWKKSIESGILSSYEASVKEIVLPVLNTTNNSVSQLDDEIRLVCSSICLIADNLLPKLRHRKKRSDYFKDDHLSELCHTSKAAWRVWQQSGRPRDGPLRENMKLAKAEVRKKINALRARRDRLQNEYRDERFREKHKNRFKVPKTGTTHGQRLNVNGQVLTNKDEVLYAWAQHFKDLSTSKASESRSLSSLESLISTYRHASFDNEDFILDYDITTEEIKRVVKLLKKGKACGPDNILPEHIIYGGDWLDIWLKKVFNEIIHLERMPSSFKDTTIVPIYKGKGRDPLLAKNYRGISLSSVIGKLFERVLLLRMIPVLEEKGIPQCTQTAYQAGVSCSDATEVVQEVIKSYIDSGATIFQSLYDLEKAFDSIDHNVLLKHLYKSGINGKAWRVIGAFYEEVEASVRLGTRHSEKFHLERGVKQGAVLSPLLFLLVIDSLLVDLESSGTGALLNSVYLGSLGHADDVRSISPNIALLEQQASIVKKFTMDNGLRLNTDKLELQEFSKTKPTSSTMSIGDTVINSSSNTTCLGVIWSHDLSPMEIWSHDLSPMESINRNLAKARRAALLCSSSKWNCIRKAKPTNIK